MAQGDFTQFRLFNIPSDVDILVDAAPASEGVWYNNTQTLTAEKKDPDDYGEPFGFIEYQTTDGTVTSEVTLCPINLLVNPGTTPGAVNYSNTILNDDLVTFTHTLLQLNDGCDRIRILTFKEIGTTTVNGGNVIPNQEVARKDLPNFQFQAESVGHGPNYQVITYQCGNASGYDATIYSITLSISGASDLDLASSSQYSQLGRTIEEYNLEIPNGVPGGVADIDVDINLNSVPNTNSRVEVIIGGLTAQYDTNQIVNLTPTIPESNAILTFTILVDFDDTELPETGTITVTLNDIDGDAGLVSGSNQQVLNLTL